MDPTQHNPPKLKISTQPDTIQPNPTHGSTQPMDNFGIKDCVCIRCVVDLPRACWRLLINPVYMTLIISLCITFSISGYTTFLPKYLQFYFGLSASWASVYTGARSRDFEFVVGRLYAGKFSAGLRWVLLMLQH